MTAALFAIEPYKTLKDRFNVRAVFRASAERGMDEPRQRVLQEDRPRRLVQRLRPRPLHAHRRGPPHARDRRPGALRRPRRPRQQPALRRRQHRPRLLRARRSTTPASPEVFVHELGHSFAGLADEYYASEVSYNDFYPKGVEPLEPNITALLDPAHVKWTGPALARDRRPDRVRQGPDRGPPGRAREDRAARARPSRRPRSGGAADRELKEIEARFKRPRRRSRPRSRPSGRNTPPSSTRSASSRGRAMRPRGSTGP